MSQTIIGGRYIVKSSIGKGGYASVILAFDKITKQDVAIKFLKCNVDENKDDKNYQMFLQEGMTLAAIRNPNVVSIHSTGIHENMPYLAMEYVKGKSIKKLIEENVYLLVDEVYSYMLQIINGLETCHNANIVHRDIKPQNIIKKADGVIVIIDFGTAYIAEADKNLYEEDKETIIGTVQYMDPYYVQHHIWSVQTDIYSLGIMMFEMLTGKLPFVPKDDPNNKTEILLMQIKEKFPSVRKYNPKVHKAFENIIYKCCEKDPKDRYHNVHELKIDLINAYNESLKKQPDKKRGFFSFLFKRKDK